MPNFSKNSNINIFESVGVIRLEPKSRSTPLRPWWALIEVCPDLSRYYLEVAKKHWWHLSGLQRPAWGGHISMIRGEEPPGGQVAWSALKDVEIEFKYDHKIQTDGKHFWLQVFCEIAEDIREDLGLSRQPVFPFHLTFAVAEGSQG